MNRVSIVIVNYNGRDYLSKLSDSLNEQGVPYDEVIVVDNCSTDGGYRVLLGKLRNILYIFREKNEGFPSAVNRGIMSARNDYIVLLNNDIYLDSDFIKNAVMKLECDNKHFFAPLVMDYEGERIDSAGDIYDIQVKPVKRYSGMKPDMSLMEDEFVDGFSMSACFFRKNDFLSIGKLDEKFIMYFEDVDFCMRAAEKGYKTMFVPEVKAYHKISAGTKSEFGSDYSPRKVFFESRNRVFLLKKHYLNRKFFVILVPFLYGTCTSVIFHIMNTGYFLEYLKGMVFGIVQYPDIEK